MAVAGASQTSCAATIHTIHDTLDAYAHRALDVVLVRPRVQTVSSAPWPAAPPVNAHALGPAGSSKAAPRQETASAHPLVIRREQSALHQQPHSSMRQAQNLSGQAKTHYMKLCTYIFIFPSAQIVPSARCLMRLERTLHGLYTGPGRTVEGDNVSVLTTKLRIGADEDARFRFEIKMEIFVLGPPSGWPRYGTSGLAGIL